MRARLAYALAALALAGCSPASEEQAESEPIRFRLADRAPDPDQLPMPGKIDPEDARWVREGDTASYGEPAMPPLLEISCRSGMIRARRNVPSDDGAKAMLAFVGYRGILRLPVGNDGNRWEGALEARDPHWIAITGGPFYATVAGGGKVISPASSALRDLVDGCKARPADGMASGRASGRASGKADGET